MSVRLSALFFLIASLSMAYAATHASYTWPDPASGLVSARLTFASEKSYLATTDTTNKKAACQTPCDDDAACQGFVYGPDADSYMCFQLAAPNHYPLAAGAFEGAFDVVWKFGAASICSSGSSFLQVDGACASCSSGTSTDIEGTGCSLTPSGGAQRMARQRRAAKDAEAKRHVF